MDGQISMFEMMNMDETPVIPFEEQKRGMKGWVIEISGIYEMEGKKIIGVTTKQVVLERDSYTRYNRILDRNEQWQSAHCTGVGGCRGDGWSGTPEKLYVRKPLWRELEKYVRENEKTKYDGIVFTYKDGHAMTHIGEYK